MTDLLTFFRRLLWRTKRRTGGPHIVTIRILGFGFSVEFWRFDLWLPGAHINGVFDHGCYEPYVLLDAFCWRVEMNHHGGQLKKNVAWKPWNWQPATYLLMKEWGAGKLQRKLIPEEQKEFDQMERYRRIARPVL